MIDTDKIVKKDRCTFRGNVLLIFKTDRNNNSRVVSTGEENVFRLERNRERGIISECYLDINGAANYYVEQAAMGATCIENFLFPNGLEDAVSICREIYRKEVQPKHETILLEKRDVFVRDEIMKK